MFSDQVQQLSACGLPLCVPMGMVNGGHMFMRVQRRPHMQNVTFGQSSGRGKDIIFIGPMHRAFILLGSGDLHIHATWCC